MSLYDGHLSIQGMDAGTDELLLPRSLAALAINRTFRKGNKTRPLIREHKLTFDSQSTENAIAGGVLTGAKEYSPWRNLAPAGIAAHIHDRLVSFRTTGPASTHVKTLTDGANNGRYMLSNFVQILDRMYWFSGNSGQRPIGWNGVEAPYVIEAGDDKMPTAFGGVAAHGRLILFTHENYLVISDHVASQNISNTKGAESFIERQENTAEGSVPIPGSFGEIAWASTLRRSGGDGRGDVVVMCRNGAFTMDITGARDTWAQSGALSQILFEGSGGISPMAFTPANTDIWYLTDDGITSVRVERSEREKAWGSTVISREVSPFLNLTAPFMAPFATMAMFDRRLLTTVAPQRSVRPLGGVQWFSKGIVALDFDHVSTFSQRGSATWDGLWTGINPIQIVVSQGRCFVFSHDDERGIRLFELVKGYGDDLPLSGSKLIQSEYVSARIGQRLAVNEPPKLKKLNYAVVRIASVLGDVKIQVHYRTAESAEWAEMSALSSVASEPELQIVPNTVDVIPSGMAFVTPSLKTPPKSDHFQFRVKIDGSAKVEELIVGFDLEDVKFTHRCSPIKIDTGVKPGYFDYSI